MADTVKGQPRPSRSQMLVVLKFLIASAMGILLFLFPFSANGSQTIGVGLIVDGLSGLFAPLNEHLVVAALAASVIGSATYLLKGGPQWREDHPVLYALGHSTLFWLCFRVVGLALALMVYLEVGPLVLRGPQTGETILRDIQVPVLYIVVVSCTLLPLLTDFGFIEFVGRLLRAPFRILFRLPGQAAIDAMTSIAAASLVGLALTIRQLENGVYTTREAAAIATSFTIVSVPFCLVVASVARIDHLFFPWYGGVIACCLVVATLTARLPPISRLADRHLTTPPVPSTIAASSGLLGSAWTAGLDRAAQTPGILTLLGRGLLSALEVCANLLAPAMAVSTLTLALVNHTEVFSWISFPASLLLDAMGVEQSEIVATALFIGFLDMFMPALLASELADPATRFVIAGLTVGQLVYMSDYGLLVLRSPIPLRLVDLAGIFLLRTALLLPLLCGLAWLVI